MPRTPSRPGCACRRPRYARAFFLLASSLLFPFLFLGAALHVCVIFFCCCPSLIRHPLLLYSSCSPSLASQDCAESALACADRRGLATQSLKVDARLLSGPLSFVSSASSASSPLLSSRLLVLPYLPPTTRKLTLDPLRYSPSPALRYCATCTGRRLAPAGPSTLSAGLGLRRGPLSRKSRGGHGGHGGHGVRAGARRFGAGVGLLRRRARGHGSVSLPPVPGPVPGPGPGPGPGTGSLASAAAGRPGVAAAKDCFRPARRQRGERRRHGAGRNTRISVGCRSVIFLLLLLVVVRQSAWGRGRSARVGAHADAAPLLRRGREGLLPRWLVRRGRRGGRGREGAGAERWGEGGRSEGGGPSSQ